MTRTQEELEQIASAPIDSDFVAAHPAFFADVVRHLVDRLGGVVLIPVDDGKGTLRVTGAPVCYGHDDKHAAVVLRSDHGQDIKAG